MEELMKAARRAGVRFSLSEEGFTLEGPKAEAFAEKHREELEDLRWDIVAFLAEEEAWKAGERDDERLERIGLTRALTAKELSALREEGRPEWVGKAFRALLREAMGGYVHFDLGDGRAWNEMLELAKGSQGPSAARFEVLRRWAQEGPANYWAWRAYLLEVIVQSGLHQEKPEPIDLKVDEVKPQLTRLFNQIDPELVSRVDEIDPEALITLLNETWVINYWVDLKPWRDLIQERGEELGLV